MVASGLLFDRRLLKRNRDRAAPSYSFPLKDIVVQDLAERLQHIKTPLHHCVDLGAHTGQLAAALKDIDLISMDLSERMIYQAPSPLRLVGDEEVLPFATNSLDLVMSALSLHWVNDLPGMLTQIQRCLNPNGVFLAAMFGEETLIELRDCFATAELELSSGISPRISPMLSIKDAGMLLQRAGFALPVVDRTTFKRTYPHPTALLQELRSMGETNVLYQRSQKFLSRALLSRTMDIYQERYSQKDGTVIATFDVITLTGWKTK